MKPTIVHEKNINIENYLSGTIFSDGAFSYITNQKKNYLVPRHQLVTLFFQTLASEIVILLYNYTDILLDFI
jgi:hypothetical protein